MTSRLGATHLAIEAIDQRIASGGSVETRMLWGPGHQLIEHAEFARLAGALGLSEYWKSVARSHFCNVDGMGLSSRTPRPEDEPDSLKALLETVNF